MRALGKVKGMKGGDPEPFQCARKKWRLRLVVWGQGVLWGPEE